MLPRHPLLCHMLLQTLVKGSEKRVDTVNIYVYIYVYTGYTHVNSDANCIWSLLKNFIRDMDRNNDIFP